MQKQEVLGACALAMAVGGLLAPRPAAAQAAATVREVVRVVKLGRANSPQLVNATAGTPLNPGDRIRTAGRSFAGVRFPDQSLLRLGELTEVVVSSSRRQTQVLRGQVFADYRRPGTISGGYAVAAVRGTQVHYIVDEEAKTAYVRCYKGEVFVSSPDNPVFAGVTSEVTATTVRDEGLINSEADWVGAQLSFDDGPYRGQTRRVTTFDRATGTLGFTPGLPTRSGGDTPSAYMVLKDPRRPPVQLRENTGTTVRAGQAPAPTYRVPNSEFAGLQRQPFFRQMNEGVTTVYAGTPENNQFTEQTFQERQAIQEVTNEPGQTPGGGNGNPPQDCIFFSKPGKSVAAQQLGVSSLFAMGGGGRGGGTTDDAGAATFENLFLRSSTDAPYVRDKGQQTQWLFEPFGIVTDRSDAIGSRLRFQGVSGDVFMELGYLYTLLDGRSQHDVSEGFLHIKTHSGDFILGRQHLFLGPANNYFFGSLLSIRTADAAVYRAPVMGNVELLAGYLFDKQALDPGGYPGFFLRGRTKVLRGNAGISLLQSMDDGTNLGWSVDASQSVLPNVIDLYGEFGVNPYERRLTTVGLYVPKIYQDYKVDVFLEYNFRQDEQERMSLRLRRELFSGLLAIAFVDRIAGSGFTGGGGLMYSKTFK